MEKRAADLAGTKKPLTNPDNELPGTAIRVMSHNVFWMQGTPFATDDPPEPHPGIVDELVALYQRIDVDVLCLQELQNEGAARMLAQRLGMHWLWVPGNMFPAYGGAVLSRWPLEPAGAGGTRFVQRVRLRPAGIEPLLIANVHLPSARQAGSEEAQKQRLRDVLTALGDGAARPRQPDLIVGDFNEPPTGQCAALLSSRGYIDAAQLCGSSDAGTTLSGRRIDHVWLAAHVTAGLGAYEVVCVAELSSAVDGKQFVSDHLPVIVSLR